MSEATATGRRPGVFSRIFNALVGDTAPEGVDPALHRRALWWAFVFTAVAYTAYFLLTLPVYFPLPEAVVNLLCGVGRPFGIIYCLPPISGSSVWQALLLPVLIYAIVLKTRGAQIPLATLDIAACAMVGYALHMTLPTKYFELPLALLVMFVLMALRGHLSRRIARFIAAVLLSLRLLQEAFILTVSYGPLHMWAFLEFPIEPWLVFSILWLPLSIALPIALMAKPHTPRLRPRAEKSWQLTSVLLLTGVLATASYVAHYTTALKGLPEGVLWMISVTLLVTLLWLYKTGRATRDFLTFLSLALAGFVVMESVLPLIAMPHGMRLWLTMAIAALAALMLSTGIPLRRTNLWAAGALLVGSIAAAFWHGYMYERFIKRTYDLQWRIDPGEFVKMELALLVALALFVVPLLFAWWFVKPKEIEALMPWGKSSGESR